MLIEKPLSYFKSASQRTLGPRCPAMDLTLCQSSSLHMIHTLWVFWNPVCKKFQDYCNSSFRATKVGTGNQVHSKKILRVVRKAGEMLSVDFSDLSYDQREAIITNDVEKYLKGCRGASSIGAKEEVDIADDLYDGLKKDQTAFLHKFDVENLRGQGKIETFTGVKNGRCEYKVEIMPDNDLEQGDVEASSLTILDRNDQSFKKIIPGIPSKRSDVIMGHDVMAVVIKSVSGNQHTIYSLESESPIEAVVVPDSTVPLTGQFSKQDRLVLAGRFPDIRTEIVASGKHFVVYNANMLEGAPKIGELALSKWADYLAIFQTDGIRVAPVILTIPPYTGSDI